MKLELISCEKGPKDYWVVTVKRSGDYYGPSVQTDFVCQNGNYWRRFPDFSDATLDEDTELRRLWRRWEYEQALIPSGNNPPETEPDQG